MFSWWICAVKQFGLSLVVLTGVLRQPSFAVSDLMRMKRLLVRQRLVSFADSNPSRSVLRNDRRGRGDGKQQMFKEFYQHNLR